jgi:thioredoxin 1
MQAREGQAEALGLTEGEGTARLARPCGGSGPGGVEVVTEPRIVTTDTFNLEVLQAAGPVVVDFGAGWCKPCRMLDPVVEELASEWVGRVDVRKLDIDENMQIAVRFGVMGVPTLILFIGGEAKERLSGFVPKKRIQDVFGPHLPAVPASA